MKVTFSPLATDDLMEIASFIAHDNPARALTFVDQLEQKCHLLGVSPGLGTSRPELGAGVKMLPFGRYLIFYRERARVCVSSESCTAPAILETKILKAPSPIEATRH